MTIKIGSNLASLNAQRRLGESSAALGSIYERLSSGQRINRASDDAAGLAIADDLKAKGRIYSQAIRNGNDGISLLNIADSAIDNLTSIVLRIRELSEQAANGSYSSKQRDALDAEAQQLSKEFSRISQTTSFNGIKLFNGSLSQGVQLQLGIGNNESINASIGGAIGTGSLENISSLSTESLASLTSTLGDLNGDGILDLVTAGYNDSLNGYATVRLGLGNGSFGSAAQYSTESYKSSAVSLGDLNGDGILDLITAGREYVGNGLATIRLGNGDGSFGAAVQYTTEARTSKAVSVGDLNGDGILDLVTTGYDDSSRGIATIRLGMGNGNFGSARQYTTESGSSNALSLSDINNDGILDLVTAGQHDFGRGVATFRLGAGNGTFGAATQVTTDAGGSFALSLNDLNNDGNLDLITAGTGATIRLGTGSGSFGAASHYATEGNGSSALSIGDLNGDGILDLITAGWYDSYGSSVTIRLGTGNGSFGSSTQFTTNEYLSNSLSVGDLNGDGVSDIVTAGSDYSANGNAIIRLGSAVEGVGALQQFSLKTRQSALQTMSLLDQSISNLSKQRGKIGASQSRVNIAISNLQTSSENLKSAESRIRDADIAAESAQLIRTQILQKAASAVLAQANQAPALVLQLLN